MVLTRLPFFCLTMYLLYLDGAGSVGNPSEQHYILSGIAIFERQIHWLNQSLEAVVKQTEHPHPEELELHGNEILNGRGWWRKGLSGKNERRKVIRHALAAARSLQGSWALFGVVVDKIERSPEDPVEYAFEQLCNRFDRYLVRMHRSGNKQRGLLILDKTSRETRLQNLSTEFRKEGHRWGYTRNIADVPFFVDSAATRVIQYADLVAYAMWRKFEMGDDEFFNVISDLFDAEGPSIHGLHHFKNKEELCDCPACGGYLPLT